MELSCAGVSVFVCVSAPSCPVVFCEGLASVRGLHSIVFCSVCLCTCANACLN